MDKTKYQSWADFSEDESSETEEVLPPLDPIQLQIIESINSSKQSIYQFKIENLPYKLTGPEQVFNFLQLSENEASIRLQFKGKKFSGFALVSTEFREVALKIAFKYGHCFEARPVLIYYKSEESLVWIPQKHQIPNSNLSQTVSFDCEKLEKDEKVEVKGKGRERERDGKRNLGKLEILQQDPAILDVVAGKMARGRGARDRGKGGNGVCGGKGIVGGRVLWCN